MDEGFCFGYAFLNSCFYVNNLVIIASCLSPRLHDHPLSANTGDKDLNTGEC